MGRKVNANLELRQLSISQEPGWVAQCLSHLPGLIWLDSAISSGSFDELRAARWSVVAADPVEVLRGSLDDVSQLESVMAEFRIEFDQLGHKALPRMPFGGLLGWVTYEGEYCFGVYPECLAFDHLTKVWYGWGNLDKKLKWPIGCEAGSEDFKVGQFEPAMTQASFMRKVMRIKEYIASGDIYQVNLCHGFATNSDSSMRSSSGGLALYSCLREASPAPMAAYLNLGEKLIFSSSPETFLEISGSRVATRPIKGTRPRFDNPLEDLRSAEELLRSDKERAELIMITDLLRNDLGKVAEFGTVSVESMLKLEKFEQVFHLVSTVSCQLRDEVSHFETLAACFPGGSITGAPKKRAMQIIDELESSKRGVYTGAIGYFGFNQQSQFSIPIRTLIFEGGRFHFHVGAGIVADSEPAAEYQETLHKAAGILAAVDKFRKIGR